MKQINSYSALCFCIIFWFCCNNVFAQDINETKKNDASTLDYRFEVSIYFGSNFTWFSGNTTDYAELYNTESEYTLRDRWRVTIPTGISAQYNVNSWLSIKSGILYSPKGMLYVGKIEDTYGGFSRLNLLLKCQYLEIPSILELTFNSRLYLDLGVSPSFLVHSKIKTSTWQVSAGAKVSDENDYSADWENVYNSDLGIIIGAGLKSSSKMYFVLQYEKGLKRVPKETGWNFNNQTITFLMGFYINRYFGS